MAFAPNCESAVCWLLALARQSAWSHTMTCPERILRQLCRNCEACWERGRLVRIERAARKIVISQREGAPSALCGRDVRAPSQDLRLFHQCTHLLLKNPILKPKPSLASRPSS